MPDYGPYSPGLVTSDSSAGDQFWSSPSAASASDDTSAGCVLEDGSESYRLRCITFSAAVPDTETVTSVEVEYDALVSGGGLGGDTPTDCEVALIVDGVIGSTSLHQSEQINNVLEQTYSRSGSPSDWGFPDLTPAQANASAFGCVLRFANDTGDYRTVKIDHVRVTITTSESSGVAVGAAAGTATAAAVGTTLGVAVGSAAGSSDGLAVGAGPGEGRADGLAIAAAVGVGLNPAAAAASAEGMSAASGAGAVGSRVVAGVVKSISVSNGLVTAARGGLVLAVDVTAGEVPTITSVPSTATSTGTVGQIAYDTSYLYVCVATDTWRRVAIASW